MFDIDGPDFDGHTPGDFDCDYREIGDFDGDGDFDQDDVTLYEDCLIAASQAEDEAPPSGEPQWYDNLSPGCQAVWCVLLGLFIIVVLCILFSGL